MQVMQVMHDFSGFGTWLSLPGARAEVPGFPRTWGESRTFCARVRQMAFFNPALLLLREALENLAQVPPKLFV